MRAVVIAFFTLISSMPVVAQLNKELGDVSQIRGAHSSDTQITSALKEALTYGITNASRVAGTENGFWGNQSIRIPLPDKMHSLEKGLRMMGQGLKIDEFDLSMNRAAEDSVPAALPLFLKAIADLNFSDARGTLNGSKSAATDYLRQSAFMELSKGLHPAAEAAMSARNVVENYNALVIQMKGLTFGQVAPFDIREYVVERTLSGLLTMLGKEEEKIRSDSSNQVTPLVREVFTKQ